MLYLIKAFCSSCWTKNNVDWNFNPSRPDPERRGKNSSNFYFGTSYGDSKGFIYALKSFIKPFEAPQRSVKIKNQVIFYFNTIFWNTQGGKDQVISGECFSLFQCFATNKHWNKAKKLAWKVLNFKKLICYKCVKYASVNTGLCIFSRIFYAVTKTAQLFDQFIYLFVYLFIFLNIT